MKSQLKNPKFYFMLLADSAFFVLALLGAYLLRFDFILNPIYIQQLKWMLPFLIPAKLAAFWLFGCYRGMWRYTSVADFWRLGQAALFASLLIVAIILYVNRFAGYPRSVFLIDGVLTFLLTGGLRMVIRSYHSAKTSSRGLEAFSIPGFRSRCKEFTRLLIIGAGGSGEKLLREILDNPSIRCHVVGFLDDDRAKWGRSLHGAPVLGPVEVLAEMIEKFDVQEVVISAPSATGTQMRRIVDMCKGCGIPFKTLPAIGELLNGKVSIKSLRDVNYEDLLRRPPVELDSTGIRDYLAGRTVLVTGCGGSIGSELCRQIIRFDPEAVVLLDASEANLFQIQMELHHELKFMNYHCALCRVQDRSLIEEIFQRYRPHVVFHAAAFKHVPMLEKNPWEAIFNNVYGSRVVMETAIKYGTERFVVVSTDKAVRPTNVMGASKRITELILQALQGNGTRFMAVRFGNVVGSSGSVIPLFRRQIERGGPVTVTHPEVTRYFMTIPEAAQLILQAGALGKGGEIFVLEMGTPVKIAEMAVDLIRLSGKEPHKDIEVTFTGLREGEKLYEELITQGEDVVKTSHEKIMVLRSGGQWNWNGLKQQKRFRQWLDRELEELYRTAEAHTTCAIKQKLAQIVPEYTPQQSACMLGETTAAPPAHEAKGDAIKA